MWFRVILTLGHSTSSLSLNSRCERRTKGGVRVNSIFCVDTVDQSEEVEWDSLCICFNSLNLEQKASRDIEHEGFSKDGDNPHYIRRTTFRSLEQHDPGMSEQGIRGAQDYGWGELHVPTIRKCGDTNWGNCRSIR